MRTFTVAHLSFAPPCRRRHARREAYGQGARRLINDNTGIANCTVATARAALEILGHVDGHGRHQAVTHSYVTPQPFGRAGFARPQAHRS